MLNAALCYGQIEPKKEEPRNEPVEVRCLTKLGRVQGRYYDGKVLEVNSDYVIIREVGRNSDRVLKFFPIDLFSKSKVLEDANPDYSYLWSDIKIGDSITLLVAVDTTDSKPYGLQLTIWRRPGAAIPPSQKPAKQKNLLSLNITNDIENGLDVDDAAVAIGFPELTYEIDGIKKIFRPGGLPPEWKTKLEANREKLKAEQSQLKAKPAEPTKK